MSPAALVHEAWSNIVTGTSRPISTCVLWLCLGLALFGVDALTVAAAQKSHDEWHERGGGIYIVSKPGGIDARACEHLGASSDVQAAGAAKRPPDAYAPSALPRAGTSAWEVTPGLAHLLTDSRPLSPQGLLLTNRLAERLSITPGEPLSIMRGAMVQRTMVVIGIAAGDEQDGRLPLLSNSLLFISSARDGFDSCWVRIREGGRALATSLLFTTVHDLTSKDPPRVTRWNPTLAESEPTAPTARATWFLPATLPLVGLVVTGSGVIRRRRDLAFLRQAGVTSTGLWWLLCLESIAWVLPFSTTLIAVLTHSGMPAPVVRQWLLAVALALLTAWGALLTSRLVDPRHLWLWTRTDP